MPVKCRVRQSRRYDTASSATSQPHILYTFCDVDAYIYLFGTPSQASRDSDEYTVLPGQIFSDVLTLGLYVCRL